LDDLGAFSEPFDFFEVVGMGEAEGMVEGSDEGTLEGWGEAEGMVEGSDEGTPVGSADFFDLADLGVFVDLGFNLRSVVAGAASAPLTTSVTKARVRREAREEKSMMKENKT
jgi:hypothetical protein